MSRIRIPSQRIQAAFASAEANVEDRTIPVQFYSGAAVLQFNWDKGLHNLVLSTDPKDVRLATLNTGRAPFTKGHRSSNDPDAVIGRIVEGSATMAGGKGRAVVQFAKDDPEADRVWNKVVQGVLQCESGSRYSQAERNHKRGRRTADLKATDWEPNAIASVARGADPNAHFQASDSITETECEVEFAATTAKQEMNMNGTTTQQAAAAAASATTTTTSNHDAAAIRAQAGKLKMSALGEDLIARGVGINEAREVLLNRIADADEAIETRSHHSMSVTFGRDSRDGLVEHMAEALSALYGRGTE